MTTKTISVEDRRRYALEKFKSNRVLAHEVLFAHRHGDKTPDFHHDLINQWHDAKLDRIVTEGFRGGGKSTRAEEFVLIRTGFREFANCLIVGASEDRAMERLTAIKHEIESNEDYIDLFEELKSAVWTEHKVVLANGVCIQARGRGQSLRGVKYLDKRPDLLLIDDLEDDEDVSTPEARRKTQRWLYRTLLPALDKRAMIRYIGNRLDRDAVIVRVSEDPNWHHQRFPIKHRDPKGEWEATWPARFPLSYIENTEAEYARQGMLTEFMQEYMCEAGAESEMTFKRDQVKVEPRVRTWEATFAMIDPARTSKKTSATTGGAVYSWIGNKLLVWEGFAKILRPDEIIGELFKIDDKYRPVFIAIEEDGLEEFLSQPLRAEQSRRGHILPIRAVRAPRDRSKDDFISGLQPFFNAGEVIFAQALPEEPLSQLLSFPTGRKDFPNALAYAPRLRPAGPIYEEFNRENIMEVAPAVADRPYYLVMNATPTFCCGVLAQYYEGIRVFADWVREGDPGQVASDIVASAKLEIGDRRMRVVIPPEQWDRYQNVGLPQAIGRTIYEPVHGGKSADGIAEIRNLLRRRVKEYPAFMVGHGARWTLNALAGGYSRDYRDGKLTDGPREGPYKTLMNGLESFAALTKTGASDREDDEVNYAETPDGRRYITTMPGRDVYRHRRG